MAPKSPKKAPTKGGSEFREKLSDRVRKLLGARSWSVAELARRSSVDASLLSRLMSGDREWKLEHANPVASAFEMLVSELLRGTTEEALLSSTEAQSEEALRLAAQQFAAVQLDLSASRHRVAILEELLRERPSKEDCLLLQEQLNAAADEAKRLRGALQAQEAENQRLNRTIVDLNVQLRVARDTARSAVANAQELERLVLNLRQESQGRGNLLAAGSIAALLIAASQSSRR